MNNNDINRQLKRIHNEDLVWVVYFFIVIAAFISNEFERKYIFQKNANDKKKYKTINVCIFTISLFIYLYFASILIEDWRRLKNTASQRTLMILNIKIIAAILFIIGGLIYLVFEIDEQNDEIGII